MTEEKKKSGLQKDISSIFAGLEDIDNGRQTTPPPRVKSTPGPTADIVRPAASLPDRPAGAVAPGSLPGPTGPAPRLVKGGAFPKNRNSFIGLDIGYSSIKLIQIYPVSGGWEIGGYAVGDLPAGGEEKGLLDSESVVGRLKNIFSETGASRGRVICSLRAGEVLTTLVQLARMPKNEIESACRLEAGRWANFSVDKAFLQEISVDRESVRPGGKVNHIVAVAGRETVSRMLGVLREAGLQVSALLPLPFAWRGYLLSILRCEENSVAAVVDVGSTRTLVSIYKGCRLRFSREFEVGGRQITEAIVQAGKTFGVAGSLPGEEAETIKRTVDLFSSESNRSVKGNLTASQVAGMARPVLEKIVQESKRSFDYYRQLYRQEEVGRVFLCGGGSLMPGFLRFFRERTRQPVEVLGLSDQLKLHSSLGSGEEIKAIFPRLVRSAALSLSRKWEINFIPPLDKILQNVLRRKMAIIIPVLALCLVSYIFYRSKADLIPVHRRLVEQKREELAGIQDKLAPYQVLAGLQGRLAARNRLGLADAGRRPNWRGILKEFSRITPANVVITGIMTLKGEGAQRILCSGRVIDSNVSPQTGVTQFIVRVENSPFFKEVEKISEDIDRGTFSFSCTLIY